MFPTKQTHTQKNKTKDKSIDQNISRRLSNNKMVKKIKKLKTLIKKLKILETPTKKGKKRFLEFTNDKAVVTIKYALYALNRFIGNSGFGHAAVAVYQCTLNALSNGFKI